MMEQVQRTFSLSERLMRVINGSNPPISMSLLNGGVVGNHRQYACDSINSLVADGADVNAMSGNLLPLHCACVVGDSSSVKLLLRHGANINKLDGFGRSALHYASERSQHCVELLLKRGASVNAIDTNRCTPLHWAAYKNKSSCSRTLLEAGANPDASDIYGDTPLSVAAFKGHLETIRVLLEYNANVDVVNAAGKTPLDRLAETVEIGIGSAQDDACLTMLAAVGRPISLRSSSTLLHTSRRAVRRYLRPGRVSPLVARLDLPSALKYYLTLGNNSALSSRC